MWIGDVDRRCGWERKRVDMKRVDGRKREGIRNRGKRSGRR
jgi:hypothetical protein